MADEETYGLDDDLPTWADEVHGIPADDLPDDEEPVADMPLPLDPFGDEGLAFDDPFGEVLTISQPVVQVGLLHNGVPKWFSQRPKPFTNCMFASLCTPLSYMGYDLPDTFVAELRKASGVPASKATSTRDTKTAMRKLIPDADLRFGLMEDDELRRRLNSGEISARVMVRNPDLPSDLRKFTGDFPGGHAIALARPKSPAGNSKVRWLDPMGRPRNEYDGVDIEYEHFQEALMRTSGMVRVTYGRHNAALDSPDVPEPPEDEPLGAAPAGGPVVNAESATVLTRARLNEFVRVEKGTRFLHQRTQEEVTKASDTTAFRMAGRSVDGRYYGVWVNTRRLRGAKGLTLLLVEQDRVGKPFIE